MTSTATIENTSLWRIVSYGNGMSYSFDNKQTGASGHLQGDDATEWRDRYDAMELASGQPTSVWYNATWDECLTELCGEYVQ